MKIVSIDFNSSINEINVDENFIKDNHLIKIYYWRFNDKQINCYVNIEENILRNTHILPPNGISDIFDIESNEIEIENTIYMIAKNKSVFCDLTLEEYGLFYFELNETSSSSSDEEVIMEDDIEKEPMNIVKKIEDIQINTNNTLDIDMNIY